MLMPLSGIIVPFTVHTFDKRGVHEYLGRLKSSSYCSRFGFKATLSLNAAHT